MRVLVTGVSGFLGGRLARLLCAEGHQVRGAFCPGDPLGHLADLARGAAPQFTAHPCHLLDGPTTQKLLAGVEAVIHTAALVSFDPGRYQEQLRLNVGGTRLLLDSARAAGVRRFLYTSTVNTLGIPAPGQVGDEKTPYNWHPWALGYMDSKRAAQDLVLAAGMRGELEALALLPGTLFGPGDVNDNAGQYILQAARGRLLAAPPGGTSVVHVDDVARGHLQALTRGAPGRRYVLGGENLSYRRLYTLIAEELGVPPPRITLTPAALRLPGRLCDHLRGVGLPLPLSEGVAVAACARLHYSSERAERALGYQFRPARQAIKDAVAWYRARGLGA